MRSERLFRSRALAQGILSFAFLGFSTVAMLSRMEPFASCYYAFAWWSFIIFVDALVLALQGHSLLTRNPREFLVLSAMSVPFWLTFEGWNLGMRNWYYAGAFHGWLARWLYSTICFATVLPAIFEATELVGALGILHEVRVRPIRAGGVLYTIFFAIGGLFLLLPLLVPKYGFPFIWCGFFFLLEPFNHRWARRSLLREWENGSMGMLTRLLLGGLICGFAWEAFNIRASTKWIYTVPFFEDFKLFEMPLAGFLGFPPFAVQCYGVVQFVGISRGGKGWESGDEQAVRPSVVRSPMRWVIIIMVVLGCMGMFHLLDRFTNNSLLPRVQDLESLAPEEVAGLRKAGVRRLDLWSHDPDRLKAALSQSGLSSKTVDRWERLAALASLKQMGTDNVRLLVQLGIQSTKDLARQNPVSLGPKMRTLYLRTGWGRQAPRDAQVRLWVKEARKVHDIR
jgi:hypothetical protein